MDDLDEANELVSREVRYLCQLPSPDVVEYNGLNAYGNHFRIEGEVIGNTHVSYDSGVAAVATTTCQSSASDRRPVDAALKYIGVLRKIMVVAYGPLKMNVMKCTWTKPNLVGHCTIKQDSYGFWLVKRDAFLHQNAEPYILPAHASQVRAISGHMVSNWFLTRDYVVPTHTIAAKRLVL